jgi:hypothetical protein
MYQNHTRTLYSIDGNLDMHKVHYSAASVSLGSECLEEEAKKIVSHAVMDIGARL